MEEYLARILNRNILPGSLFLAFIAIIPRSCRPGSTPPRWRSFGRDQPAILVEWT
jgi:hypothetical protein